jgi:hypothetical protein
MFWVGIKILHKKIGCEVTLFANSIYIYIRKRFYVFYCL